MKQTGNRAVAAVFVLSIVVLFLLASSCTNEDNPLTQYTSTRPLSDIAVQESTFTPVMRWIGGYVSVLGVNRGPAARLDTSLAWAVLRSGDALPYPVTYGTIPSGAQDVTPTYGGRSEARLREDQQYTFWLMKEDAWKVVSTMGPRTFKVDSTQTVLTRTSGDTVYIAPSSFTVYTRFLDVYINIGQIQTYGRLGVFNIIKSDTSNRPYVTFRITQSGVTDSAISAIGVVLGGIYTVAGVTWEMISEQVLPDTTIYWKQNVIHSPLQMGDHVPGTATFVEYPVAGLERGKQYYIWMANKDWDQQTRLRSTPNYAFATFQVY
jgi:hypothetical protein